MASLRRIIGTLITLLLLGQAAGFYARDLFGPFDRLIYDARLRMTMPDTRDDRIAIVDIDEKSLAEIGRWPWSRDRMATLVEQLTGRYGVSLIGFDIVMPEPDHSSGLNALDQLASGPLRDDSRYRQALDGLRPTLDFDARFAKALTGTQTVLGYYLSANAAPSGALPKPLVIDGPVPATLTDWPSYGANLPAFQAAAGRAGYFNPVVDADGKVRRVALLARHHGKVYGSLSLEMVRALLGDPAIELDQGVSPGSANGMLEAIKLRTPGGTLRIPVDAHGAALVPYRGKPHSFAYISASDVIAGRTPPADLQGRIVLIGTSAPGLVDLRSTPVGRLYPGVEIHANLIEGMLDQNIASSPSYLDAARLLLLIAIGVVMVFVFPWRLPWRATWVSLTLLALVVAGDLLLWRALNWAFPMASALVLMGSLYLWNVSSGYLAEYRTRRQFTRLFGQYVPPELVEEMSREPTRYSMQGRRAELTVLFSDVRNFTTISEGLAPERLAHLMNLYLDAMTSVIQAQRGTLDKYIGDAIMAFWGAPVADTHHARHAVLAALGMQARLAELNPRLQAEGLPVLEIGIGLNTGPMTVGDMGSAVRRAYTVLGDAVNLGARLEGVTKYYGAGIIVGEATRDATPGIVYRELDRIRVKGKLEPVSIYEPCGETGALAAELQAELDQWHTALASYRRRDWSRAIEQCRQLAAARPASRLYALYLQRAIAMDAEAAPADWDGVYVFDTK